MNRLKSDSAAVLDGPVVRRFPHPQIGFPASSQVDPRLSIFPMSYFDNKTIVVPFDFSDFADQAIRAALQLASRPQLVHVVHVVVPSALFIPIDPAMPIPPTVDDDRFAEAQKHLANHFAEQGIAGIGLECRMGDPASEIVDYAKQTGAELIVMPSHGRTGFNRLLLGSVAERVLRLASCPVLVLRDGETHKD